MDQNSDSSIWSKESSSSSSQESSSETSHIKVPDGYVEGEEYDKRQAEELERHNARKRTQKILCSRTLGFGSLPDNGMPSGLGGAERLSLKEIARNRADSLLGSPIDFQAPMPTGGCVRQYGSQKTQRQLRSDLDISTSDRETSPDEQTKAAASSPRPSINTEPAMSPSYGNALAQHRASTPTHIGNIRLRLRDAQEAMESDSPSPMEMWDWEGIPHEGMVEGAKSPTYSSDSSSYTSDRRLAACSLTTDHDAPHGLFIFVPILMILMLVYVILRKSAQKWNSIRSSQTDLPATRERSTRWCD